MSSGRRRNRRKKMKILEVSRYKKEYSDNTLPFVLEQGESLRAAGCEVEYFLVRGNYITAVKALKAKIREFKPDVVHAHYGLSAITAELQSLVPVVTTFHNGETHRWWVNLLSSLFTLRAKHVIYVAEHIHQMVYFKAPNYSIIPCGVTMEDCFLMDKAEARKKLSWDADKKYIMFGGAFSNTRKNYKLLRSAIEELYNQKNYKKNTESLSDTDSISTVLTPQSTHKQASGLLDDSLRYTDIDAQYPSNDSEKNTKNIYSTANTLKWIPVEGGEQYGDIVCIEMKGLSRAECVLRMCACDLFALPSHSEGSPQALKEAMACNCPCLATDIADVRYLFGEDPGHWILRNPRKTHDRWDGDENSLNDMVRLLKEALAFEGRTKGRQRILELELSNEQIAKRIIRIYEDIIK